MTTISRFVATAAITLIGVSGTGLQAQVVNLVRHIPETANAVVVVDARSMFDSPIATREKWQENRAAHFASGMTPIPPKAKSLAVAYHLDVDVMRSEWEVAVVELDAPRFITILADQVGGVVDEVQSTPVVRLPDDSFLVQFSDGVLGAMAPGNRQKVSYWISRPNHALSLYLREAIAEVGPHADIMMALDLDNAFSAKELEQGIAKFESVKKSQLNQPAIAKLMASAKGVTLLISFRDTPYGRISFDFSEDAALIAGIAKPLILDILGSYGVMMEDVAGWKADVKGSQVSLTGSLTNDGLTQVSSLIHLPSRALHANVMASVAQGAAGSSAEKKKPTTLELTQQYLASVDSVLKTAAKQKHNLQTMGQFAQWLENDGRKLDHLPTLNMDPEALQYGRWVSQQLHNCSFALKGMGIQQAVNEIGAASSSRVYGGTLGNISQDNWQSGGYYGGGGGANYGRRVETNAAYGVARRLGPEGAVKSKVRQASSAVTTVRFQTRAGCQLRSANHREYRNGPNSDSPIADAKVSSAVLRSCRAESKCRISGFQPPSSNAASARWSSRQDPKQELGDSGGRLSDFGFSRAARERRYGLG